MPASKRPSSAVVTVLAIVVGMNYLGKTIKNTLEFIASSRPGGPNPPSF
ncbi:MAG TPA: hypothetical protein VEC37_11690 [Bacillota bacterium]|nr:hypothetical protein [Bacillota bacterium]